MTNRITFGTPLEERLPDGALPMALFAHQAIEPNSVVVLLDTTAWEAIQTHAQRYVQPRHTVECAGILAGSAFYDQSHQVTCVVIHAAIETEAASQSAGSVRINPAGFQHAREQVDQRGLRVVGWYHTHPNYGIFLSHDDQIVVQSLFNATWHIALVYDPIRNQVGCFHGPGCRRIDDHDRAVLRKRNYVVVPNLASYFSYDNQPQKGEATFATEPASVEVSNPSMGDAQVKKEESPPTGLKSPIVEASTDNQAAIADRCASAIVPTAIDVGDLGNNIIIDS